MENIDIRRLISLIALNDPAAADEIDLLADRLRALAERLRNGGGGGVGASGKNPWESAGGVQDSCRMQVVGPDGEIKSTHDTRGNSP